MEAIMHNTKLFKNIFPQLYNIKNWYRWLPLCDGDDDVPSDRTLSLIAYEYNDCHVAFSEEGFKEHFAIDLYTFYKEFEATTKAIDDLMKLTDEDISTADKMITNYANIPETENTTDVEEVDFISTQQKMISKKGMLQIKREQLSNKRAYTVRTFLNRFKHLFIKVISPAYTFVVEENEGE